MKHLILILITFCFASCGGRSYSYLADPIFASYGKEMKKKRGYWVQGTGGSMPNSDVKSLFMSFEGIRQVDIPEARRLYIELVEGLLIRVNSNESIRPFLHDYPATSKNMDLFLGFVDRKNNIVAENYISFICCVNNRIYYNKFNQKTRHFEGVYEEAYEEALKIVQSE